MNIATLDPGGTCGMALYDDGSVKLLEFSKGTDLLNAWAVLELIAGLEEVVVERFVPQPTKGYTWQSLSAMRVGAMLEALIDASGLLIEVSWQVPSDMTVASDERLKAWGWWWPGHPHAMDALRHLIVFLRRNKLRWRDLEVSHVAVD